MTFVVQNRFWHWFIICFFSAFFLLLFRFYLLFFIPTECSFFSLSVESKNNHTIGEDPLFNVVFKCWWNKLNNNDNTHRTWSPYANCNKIYIIRDFLRIFSTLIDVLFSLNCYLKTVWNRTEKIYFFLFVSFLFFCFFLYVYDSCLNYWYIY